MVVFICVLDVGHRVLGDLGGLWRTREEENLFGSIYNGFSAYMAMEGEEKM